MTLLILALLFASAEDPGITAGKKAFDLGRYEEALKIWKGVDPKNCQGAFYTGLALFRLQRTAEATVQFRAAVECAPKDVLPRIALAEATASTGDHNRALALYEEALKLDPNSADALRGAAFLAVANQSNDKAVPLLERLAKLEPAGAAIRAQLGAAYAATSRMDLAETEFQAALRLDPKNPSALTGLANVYLKADRLSDSVGLLEKAVTVTRAFEPLFLLGSAYSKQGRYQDAVARFQEAIRLDSNQSEAYYQMATALGRLNRKDEREKALQQFRDIKARSQKDDANARRAAQLVENAKPHVDRGELTQALQLLLEAHTLQPGNAEILFRTAGLQYDLRQYSEAQVNVQRAIDRTPDEWMYHVLLGLVERDRGAFAEARKALITAVRLNPRAADAYNYLGLLALRESRREEAIAHFQKAVELSPDDLAFRANLNSARPAK